MKKILIGLAVAAWAMTSNMDYEDFVLAHSYQTQAVSDEAWRTGNLAQGETP